MMSIAETSIKDLVIEKGNLSYIVANDQFSQRICPLAATASLRIHYFLFI